MFSFIIVREMDVNSRYNLYWDRVLISIITYYYKPHLYYGICYSAFT